MRNLVRFGLAAAAVLGVVLGTTTAWAATTQLHISPATVVAGHTVRFSGVCDPNTSGFVISPAFLHDSAHDFAGVGAVAFDTDSHGAFSGTAVVPVTRAPGTYAVTARCGGGNLGIERHLHVVSGHGTVGAVPAGTGGLASATGTGTRLWQYGLGVAGLGVLTGGIAGLRRQRRTHRT